KFYFKDIALTRPGEQLAITHYKVKSFSNGNYVDETNSMFFFDAGIDWINALYLTEIDNHPHLAWGPHPTFSPITGYKIYRAMSANPVNPLSLNYTIIGTTTDDEFEYTDVEVFVDGQNPVYVYYYVKAYYTNGKSFNYSSRTNFVDIEGAWWPWKQGIKQEMKEVHEFKLAQNFPNQFNPSTEITYIIPKENHVQLKVYDTFGREVAVLVKERQNVGTHTVNFNGEKLASGVYIYEMVTGEFRYIRKMLLVK
ncbi:MAG: T9SS type A sorting domain-containing protein, partial [Melioribacteraceae bacterium]|nr:T9SS type A sorting domain-containing protein [Melioribacteraceae bacterium]